MREEEQRKDSRGNKGITVRVEGKEEITTAEAVFYLFFTCGRTL
jgi:hypothetical protein